MNVNKIPVSIISGFLGAGKTTWINQQISSNKLNKNSLILVNDFGSVCLDDKLIKYQNDKIISFANGCICCTLGDNLALQLSQIMTNPSLPEHIYIEASGVSDPKTIANVIKITKGMSIADIYCLLDANQVLLMNAQANFYDIWQKQIESATILLLNRYENNLPLLKQKIHKINPRANFILQTRGEKNADNYAMKNWNKVTKVKNIKTNLVSLTLNTSQSLSKVGLIKLIEKYSQFLLRAKGFLTFNHQIELVQFGGGRLNFYPRNLKIQKTYLMIIGFKELSQFELEFKNL